MTAEASEHETLGEKIRRKIESCNVSCFVLSRREKIEDRDEWHAPAWVQGEIGIAYTSRQKMAIFVEEKVAAKGIIPNIEDYTSFSRARLGQDAPMILASMLSLRQPGLQDAIETLMNQNRLAPLIVLKALKGIMSEVANFRRMIRTIPRCPVVSLVQQTVPILILGTGKAAGILPGSSWMIMQTHTSGTVVTETPVGTVRVFYAQPELSQSNFVDLSEEMNLKDSLTNYIPDGRLRTLENMYAIAQDPNPDLLPTSSVADIDNFVRVIDQLLSLVQG